MAVQEHPDDHPAVGHMVAAVLQLQAGQIPLLKVAAVVHRAAVGPASLERLEHQH